MSELPPLAVVIFSYEGPDARRTDYGLRTIDALRKNLVWPEPVHWLIADDGSSEEHRAQLAAHLIRPVEVEGHELGRLEVVNSRQGGYGASMNLARATLAQMLGPEHLALLVEDDWELRRALDLEPFANLIIEREEVGCIRLGYIGYTQPLVGEFIVSIDGHQWLLLQRSSPEGYVFAGHPRLEHAGFFDDWRWPRGMVPGDTEGLAAKYYRERKPGPRREIIWPVDFQPASQQGASFFGHIGSLASMDYE